MNNTWQPRRHYHFLLFFLILAMDWLFIVDPPPLGNLRHASFDQFQRWHPRPFEDAGVRIIDIDEASLHRFGQWPWPRNLMAELLDKLQSAEPKLVAIDILLVEPDRTSPAAMAGIWSLTEAQRAWLNKLPDHDVQLADSLGNGRYVLGFALDQATDLAVKPPVKAAFVRAAAVEPNFLSFASAINPLPVFQAPTTGFGALNFLADDDGVIRKIPMVFSINDYLAPSLVSETIRVLSRQSMFVLNSSSTSNAHADLKIGELNIPLNQRGEMWLHYAHQRERYYIPAWQVLAGKVPVEQLNNKILLLAATAQGLVDRQHTALAEAVPGVEIHAQALEQVLTGDVLLRPVWSAALEFLVIVGIGIMLGLLTLNVGQGKSFIMLMILLAIVWFAAWQAYVLKNWLLDPLVPSLVLLVLYLSASLFRFIHGESRQHWVKQAFSQYISPNLVNYLLEHPDELQLSGEQRTCSFVFTDLENFTEFIERNRPEDVTDILNDYLEGMIAIAFAYQGTLDRIVGDGLVIMFSAPVRQPDHRQRALHCALDMHTYARRYVAALGEQGVVLGRTRIGVHCGDVLVGNFGGKTMFDYRALGDAVNTASRLEGANKYLGTEICVSEAVLAGSEDVITRPISRLLVKGKNIPLKVFELLPPQAFDEQALARYRTGYEFMRNGQSEQAVACFRRYLTEHPDDALVARHLQRLQSGESGDLWVLEQK